MRDYDSFGRINSSSLNGASSDVYAYKLTEDGATDPTLIIGSTNGNAETVNITVTSGVTQVSVKDIFGTDKGTIAVVGGNLQITANEQQKYIDGLKQQDLP